MQEYGLNRFHTIFAVVSSFVDNPYINPYARLKYSFTYWNTSAMNAFCMGKKADGGQAQFKKQRRGGKGLNRLNYNTLKFI